MGSYNTNRAAAQSGAYNVAMPLVTKLIPRRRNAWVEIVPDAGPSIKLPRQALPAAVSHGSRLDAGQWQELTVLAQHHALLDRALRILGRREHFERELARKLQRISPDRELAGDVLAQCRRLGYLDDERAAVYITEQLIARGGIGRLRLRQELLRRGCPPPLARRMVAEHGSALDERTEVARLLRGREKSTAARAGRLRARLESKGLSGERLEYELHRQLEALVQNYLAGRGFSREHARQGAAELIDRILDG